MFPPRSQQPFHFNQGQQPFFPQQPNIPHHQQGLPSQFTRNGNFLTNLLGGASKGFSPGATGFTGAGAKGLGSVHGMLNNVQHALKLFQTVSPMVQQYGPLIRNMPAIWSMFKQINSTTDTTDKKATATKTTNKTKKKKTIVANNIKSSNKNRSIQHRTKQSSPKLYIS
jgi:hypothetical protein